jgi:hypothetical protein
MPKFATLFLSLLVASKLTPSEAIWGSTQRVRMESINTLTFHEGRQTNARRVGAVPQLNCIGGDAQYEAQRSVHTVQCHKTGSAGGNNIQWKCQSELHHKYKLGETTVSCEGYDHPDDPYVLDGSCGLEYTLHRSGSSSSHYDQGTSSHYDQGTHNRQSSTDNSWLGLFGIGAAVLLFSGSFFWAGSLLIYAISGFNMGSLLLMAFLYFMLSLSSSSYSGGYREDHSRYGSSTRSSNVGGGSFFSGLGVGTAASHMMRGRSNYSQPSRSSWSSGSSSRSSRTSTGFGGTRNR